MSVYRVITRIIPLNSSESTFEPASFDALTDGHVGQVKVLDLTEPQSGMKYRIERVEYVQEVGPGETVDSVNSAYAKKLESIPGFEKLKSDEAPLNPYDKSFQLTLPKVLFSQGAEEQPHHDSFKISVVKNFNFNKPSCHKRRDNDTDDARSPKGFKTKYPSYLSKKIKNSVWGNKNKSPKSPKHQRKLSFAKRTLDVRIADDDGTQNDEVISVDDLEMYEGGDLVINVPEVAESSVRPDNSAGCSRYKVIEEHPLFDLLMSLKKYFVNGECLICGFIPEDAVDFNASEHMESHISSNSFTSSFKCSCCDEKFGSPRNLYEHSLAREKLYRYMCNICLLKFKRKHYLMRHTAKSH